MSILHDYLRNCMTSGTKVNLLIEGQPPVFIEGMIKSLNNEYLCIGQDKRINLKEIIGFPESEI